MKLHPADFKTLTPEVFRVFGTQNALLTAGDRDVCNTMTIGWCQLGRLWSIPVCTVYVRPERYTYAFMESHDYFTVSVLPLSDRQTAQVCGTKSGRDIDKIKECGLTLRRGAGDAPFFDEAEWVLVCRKLYAQDLDESCVLDERVLHHYGAKGGWHRAYTGEVVEAYTK
ncbi:flavin reductase [Oscillibacter valericigenes]|uniref:flavin reductase family protein n=1 Tax=Oscillibacter valericigenes TaxID=351091 RepID=UPI001F38F701|nr:flavin reductase [Oscillibacter valericigenes]MCF2617613.1 flavin reductase [Oscillibacter valericigenes]